jgi:hypothetical protein
MIYHLGTSVLEHYYDKAFGNENPNLSVGMRAPHGQWVRGSGTPSHARYGHPGHIYSMRPDLTRMGLGVGLTATIPVWAPVALAAANFEVIERAPEERQRGLWQMFASGLTGTVGIGSGASIYTPN